MCWRTWYAQWQWQFVAPGVLGSLSGEAVFTERLVGIQKSISHPALTGCTLHFFQYRDGVLSLFVLFVSSCVLLLAFILAFNESFFIKHQNCWCFYLIEYSTDLTLHSYNNVRLTMDSCCVLLLLLLFFFIKDETPMQQNQRYSLFCILVLCLNLAPTLTKMQFNHQQFSWRFGCVMLIEANEVSSRYPQADSTLIFFYYYFTASSLLKV